MRFTPISCADHNQLAEVMDEEERCWMSELGWDYAAVRRILSSFIEQKLLPGYVASDEDRILGYTYFLTHKTKGIIGALYASKIAGAQEVADQISSLAIACLKEASGIRRIEAQIMPFNGLNLAPVFVRHGFQYHPRYYLELDLHIYSQAASRPSTEPIVPWDPTLISLAAGVTVNSYSDQPDAQLCEDYCSVQGCESYLRSLMDNPGCGSYIPEASFMGLDNGKATYAYLFSLSSVRYLVESFGLYRANMILEELAGGATINKAVSNSLSLSYEEFELGWKRSLE